MREIGVRPATDHDVATLTGVAARAFTTDPPLSWVFRDVATRTARLEVLFDGALREVFLPLGESYTTTDVAGCALWAPPGRWRTPDDVVERLAPAMSEEYTPDEFGRLLTFFAVQEEHHPGDEEHWYLGALAVDPARQGQGIGSACMRPLLARLDEEGAPAYLESSNARNVPLYERHGFRVTGIVDLPDLGPPVWRMWRDPR